jgi:predicted transcriptional regulator
MKTGIHVGEIMEKEFPIMDIDMPVINCVKKLNKKYDKGIVVDKGNFYSIIGFDDLLRAFLKRRDNQEKLANLISKREDYKVVSSNIDVYDAIELMNGSEIDVILVKDKDNIVGLVTKRDVLDIQPELFDNIELDLKRESINL